MMVWRPRVCGCCCVAACVCVQEFVQQASGQLVGLYAELIGAVLPNISHSNKDIQVRGCLSNAL